MPTGKPRHELSSSVALLSIVTPAWNEAANLPVLYERLRLTLDSLGMSWEWIVVDDHSRDESFAVVRDLATRDARVRGVSLARNSGSHLAIACGLDEARGGAAVVLAADLQDPPETLAALIEQWRNGAQVVWAARRIAPGAKASNAGFASFYYWLMRHVIGLTDMPGTGADFFLIDRLVIDAVTRCREQHVSVLALIAWLGFRQTQIEYEKQPRLHGTSGWSLRRKVKLVLDSVTAFSDLPVMACWMLGLLLFVGGLSLGLAGLVGLQIGVLAPAHIVLLGAIGSVGGILCVMLGVVGEYTWRALDESRQRPRYTIGARVGIQSTGDSSRAAVAGSS